MLSQSKTAAKYFRFNNALNKFKQPWSIIDILCIIISCEFVIMLLN